MMFFISHITKFGQPKKSFFTTNMNIVKVLIVVVVQRNSSALKEIFIGMVLIHFGSIKDI